MSNNIIGGMGFHHIALKTKELNKSVDMYRALGMTEIARWGEGASEIVMLDIGDGGRIELFANGGDAYVANGKWQHFAMCVDDVEHAYAMAENMRKHNNVIYKTALDAATNQDKYRRKKHDHT